MLDVPGSHGYHRFHPIYGETSSGSVRDGRDQFACSRACVGRSGTVGIIETRLNPSLVLRVVAVPGTSLRVANMDVTQGAGVRHSVRQTGPRQVDAVILAGQIGRKSPARRTRWYGTTLVRSDF